METKETADQLDAAYKRWREAVESELQGAAFEKKLVTRTFEGVSVQPLYTRKDLEGVAHLHAPAAGADGARRALKKGTADGRWLVCQEIDAIDPMTFNAVIREGLARGQTAVALRADRAIRAGVDPDHAPLADIGNDGVSLADFRDLAVALDGVDLTRTPVYVEAGASPLPVAAMYLSFLSDKSVRPGVVSGGLTADPLAEWATRGSLPVAQEKLYDDLAGWTLWAADHAPALATIGVSGAHWLEAGGNAVQELAFTVATAVAYLRALIERGVPAGVAARRMRFRFAVGPQLLMEVAKFRAFRLVWSRVLAGFGVAPGARLPVVHAVTGRWNKSTLDPHVNLLRCTTEALSAVLGGVDSLHVGAFDGVSGATTDVSNRIARNLHTLLADEFRLRTPVDPLAGSGCVEKLTDELARKAWSLFQDVEKCGGFVPALCSGFLQEAIAGTAAEKRDATDKRRLSLVGVNLFPNLKEKRSALTVNTEENCAGRRAEVARRRSEFVPHLPEGDWATRLSVAVSLAQLGATVAQLLRAAHPDEGGGVVVAPVLPWRAAEGFEALRSASEEFAARTGARPKVFLAKMGPPAQHKARADFSAGFFAVGGFEALAKQSFETPEEAALAAVKSGAPVAVLCSTDDTYALLAPAFVKAAKTVNPALIVVLAGYPAEQVEVLRAAGFDEFIHVRADVRGVLAQLLNKIGATTSTTTP